MNILIADDEKNAATSLARSVKKVMGEEARITVVKNGEEVLAVMEDEAFDVLFLDVEMPGLNGIDVAKKVRAGYPDTNIIVVTAYPEYALNAWELYISGYLLKPVRTVRLEEALANLRMPLKTEGADRLSVQCFGNFEVFWRGEKLQFGRNAAKEMLAYLIVKRGLSVTAGEICAALWPDSVEAERHRGYIRIYFAEIRKTLDQIGMADVLVHTRNEYAVKPEMIDCDYYRHLDRGGHPEGMTPRDFLPRYEWAEFFHGRRDV
ncbi:MAG: response regulator [Lachnospiraceae bacterium]|nr:response regulator [Lachnospiraceae bacterium]